MADIVIIGPGRVGTAIGVLAERAGWRVTAVGARNAARGAAAAAQIGSDVRACEPAEAAGLGDLVLLTVRDDAIEDLCRELARAEAFRGGASVAHCCGALSSEVLSPARQAAGCSVASIHPLQTFPSADRAIETFAGTFCFCEGDGEALDRVEALACAIGGVPIRLESSAKALYHAAASVACNYLAALLDASLSMTSRAGIDRETASKALGPLVRSTVDNVLSLGPAEALTGPIARGDVETVARHLRAIRVLPEDVQQFYRTAGRWTVELARRKGTIDENTVNRLRQTLEDATERKADGCEDH